ncbi:alpha/beta fold hydrolase [Streptomyces sp. NPDC087532]|uniref:alpha/beta fold hydrolase n=1 Tax=unclassified Streptomyces TaxID=2593676 RepID=UPI00332D4ABB
MHRYLPDATLAAWDEVGHWIQFEDPEQFNRVAVDFLTGKMTDRSGCPDLSRSSVGT